MYSEQAAINLRRPIQAVSIINSCDSSACLQDTAAGQNICYDPQQNSVISEKLEKEKSSLTQTCRALETAAAKLSDFYENAVLRYKEDIVRLSVEIARKILARQIQDGDYQIETIIKNAIQNSPADQFLEIHLNPVDYEQCKNMLQAELCSRPANIEFISDPDICRADCHVKSAKGTIESFIEIHLEKISEALLKAV